MKTMLVAIATVFVVAGCASTREINVEMISAQLVRVDTVYQGSTYQKQQLTWRDKDDIEYVSLVSMGAHYPVGIVMTLLRQR